VKTATVYWSDSTLSTSEGVWSQQEVAELLPCQMVSSGIIASETDTNIVLAKDYNTQRKDYRGVSLIPKCNVSKIVRHRCN
jgi:hypothetical protein